MNSDDREYRYSLDLGSGWVDLTLAEGSKAAAKELAAARVAQFNPLKLAVQKTSLVDGLAHLALEAYESGGSRSGGLLLGFGNQYRQSGTRCIW